MADAKADQLLAAATAGNVAKIWQLLASDSPLEATDMNRSTPAMLAARLSAYCQRGVRH